MLFGDNIAFHTEAIARIQRRRTAAQYIGLVTYSVTLYYLRFLFGGKNENWLN